MSDSLHQASSGRQGSSSSKASAENHWVSRVSVGGYGSTSQTGAIRLVPDAEVFGGFRLGERINQIANGEVWRAIRPDGQCVKLHCVDLSRSNVALEIRALNLMLPVRHPHLVTLFGPWEHAGWVAVGMDLADGSLMDQFDAARKAGQAGLEAGKLVDFLSQAARGIDHLNKGKPGSAGGRHTGLIHCRIQPNHLLMFGEVLRVGDFEGVQRFEADRNPDSQLISAQFAYPATGYSAPELFRGQISPWSDQYSLAASYYHLRSGRQPTPSFDSTTSVDLSRLPVAERLVLQRALANDPTQRWSNCQEFVDALRDVVRPIVSIPTRNLLAAQEPLLIDLKPSSEDLPSLTRPLVNPSGLANNSVQQPEVTPLRFILATEAIPAALSELDSASSGIAESSRPVDSALAAPQPEILDPIRDKSEVVATDPDELENPIVRPTINETSPAVASLPLTSDGLADEPHFLTERPSRKPNRPRRFLTPLAGVAAAILIGTVWFESKWAGPVFRPQSHDNSEKTTQALSDAPRPGQESSEGIKTSPTLAETKRIELEVAQKQIEPDSMIANPASTPGNADVAPSIEKVVGSPTHSPEPPTLEPAPAPVQIAENLPAISPPEPAKLAAIEQAKALKVEQARIAEAEQARIVEAEKARIVEAEKARIAEAEKVRIAKIEQARIVEAEKVRIAKIEQARIAEAEKARIVEAEKVRIAEIEQARIAEAERAKIAEAERARIAEVERARIVKLEQSYSLAEIKTAMTIWGESTRESLALKAHQLGEAGRVWSETHPLPASAPTPAPAPEVAIAQTLSPPAPLEPKTATILVRMPTSEAELVVRGAVGRGNPDEWYGPDRVIHSPPFTTAQDYLVGSFWTERDGRQSTRTQKLRVEPGHKYEVDLRTEPTSFRDLPPGSDQ